MQPSTLIAREDRSAIGSVLWDSHVLLVPFGVEDEGDSGVLLTGDLRSEGWSRPEPDPEDGELSEEAEFSCVWGEVLGRT